MLDIFEPTLAAALARADKFQPGVYARTRNAIGGGVSGLSPYITHGFLSMTEVLARVASRHMLDAQHKFIFELGWRAYFRHVWEHRGSEIFQSFHEGPLPDNAYTRELPVDIRQACTGVPVVDEAVRVLYATGMLHNHARMWLASYVVHMRKVHWRVGADWLYGHLLDGDLASNHLSWQWVAGTGSNKPYLFNADNVVRYAPEAWHSPGSVIDTSYEALDRIAHHPARSLRFDHAGAYGGVPSEEPRLSVEPPEELGLAMPDAATVAGRDVWLVHPWSLGALPAALPADTVVIGIFVADFHSDWPWSEGRWCFVGAGMSALSKQRWYGDAAAIGAALRGARSVRCVDEPHLTPWLTCWADFKPSSVLFPPVDRQCDSFSKWWTLSSRGLNSAADLLAQQQVPA